MTTPEKDCSPTQTENQRPFCASSPEAQLLSDADFWAAVFPQPEERDEPDMDDWPELVTTQCVRCQAGIRVEDYEEAIERQDESFCNDCADEMADEPCEWCHANRPPANVVAPPCHRCHGTGTTRDNAECQTCGGNQRVGMGSDYSRLHPCPDCTPEDVEEPCEWCDDGFVEDLDNDGGSIRCPECTPPDNVEKPSLMQVVFNSVEKAKADRRPPPENVECRWCGILDPVCRLMWVGSRKCCPDCDHRPPDNVEGPK